MRLLVTSVAVLLLDTGLAAAQPRTIQDALAAAYSTNPTLQTARAQLRATDEGVPQALAGWRPTVIFAGTVGGTVGQITTQPPDGQRLVNGRDNTPINTEQLTLTQPVYSAGATRANTNRADNQVFGQRGRLLASEQTVFTNVVNAYVNVIQSQQTLQLNINNEQVLTRQLQATNDRFRVGEITRTDVAQAEAALAGARATRQTSEGNLQTARSQYRQFVGELPDQLVEPQPLRLPVKNQAEAVQLAAQNNPNVIAALFDDAAARDNIDVQFSALMPQLSIQAQGSRTENTIIAGESTVAGQIVLSASVPLYQGGAEYAAVRQARKPRVSNAATAVQSPKSISRHETMPRRGG